MKRVFIFILLLSNLTVFAQSNEEYEVVSMIENQKFYLNSQSRLGGTTKTYLSISLPANTVSWIYMLTTVKASTPPALNLMPQVARLIDKTGLTASLVSSLTYPSGESTINAYVIPQNQFSKFMNGNEFSYYPPASRRAFNSGPVKVDHPFNSGQFYIGLENPAAISGVTVFIDVVAIVKRGKPALLTVLETIQKVIDKPVNDGNGRSNNGTVGINNGPVNENFSRQDEGAFKRRNQAANIGNLGWYAYERGDYNACIEHSIKSISIYPLFYVSANLALCYLVQGNDSLAMEQYMKALEVLSGENDQKASMQGAIKDIEDAKNKQKLNPIADDILKLLRSKL